ncbi:MAG: dTDP-4-dehydrorhamnose reductase [Acidobacteriota bacterium]|nr:dTDP-4-dehydrorhamnose reductase [Acidobacteriota bacterium]
MLVAGADGMVGRAVVEHCSARGEYVVAHNRDSMDITNHTCVSATIRNESPQTVINCAAWTDVDGCERDRARAFAVNAHAVENLAACSRGVGANFVTISTDYVFDGTKEGFYTQRDDPNPASVYATSKLEGERRAQNASARTIVVRSGWIFGEGGRNFLSTVVERARRGELLKAISDSYGTPTYSSDLAARLRELAELDLPGVYHVVNSGPGASYEEFTRAALKAAGCEAAEIEAVSADALRRPAPRPRNSRLRCLLSEAIGLSPLPYWESALATFATRT